MSGSPQDVLERAEQHQDRRGDGPRAHQADAPHLAGERPHARAHLDVELLAQIAAHRRLVDAVGYADGVQRLQPFARWRKERQAHRLEPGREHPVVALVARPARLEPFLLTIASASRSA